jgi:hypothetical protein
VIATVEPTYWRDVIPDKKTPELLSINETNRAFLKQLTNQTIRHVVGVFLS